MAKSLPEGLDVEKGQEPSSSYIKLVFAGPMRNIEYHHHSLLPSCAFQKTATKNVWVVRIRHGLSRASSIVPGKFLDFSGTGHLVAMSGAVLVIYKCPGMQGMITPNRIQLMRCSTLNRYIFGLQIWTWVSEACLNPILDAYILFFFPVLAYSRILWVVLHHCARKPKS